MKLSATFRVPQYNINAYRAALKERLGEAIAQAVFIWLDTVMPIIPVWSGASRATLRPLASQIGMNIALSPRAFINRESLGEASSTGKLNVDENAGIYSFSYSTSLEHLIYNEFNDANRFPDPTLFARLLQPGPYNFQEKGAAAFEKFAAGVRLPDPNRSLTVRIVRA